MEKPLCVDTLTVVKFDCLKKDFGDMENAILHRNSCILTKMSKCLGHACMQSIHIRLKYLLQTQTI